MNYKLFLDDERDAPDETWIVARSYKEAINIVTKYGWPEFITFDHDLGYTIPEEMLKNKPTDYPMVKTPIGSFREGVIIEKTGYDFTKWLGEYSIKNPMPRNFRYAIHSANPVGANNIRELMRIYFQIEPLTMKLYWWRS